MMKKLLLCSVEAPEDHHNDDTSPSEESHPNIKDMYPANLCRASETINIKNFNYDVIVHFVRQGKKSLILMEPQLFPPLQS